MSSITTQTQKVNKDFYGRNIQPINNNSLNLMPSEELSFRLDNVLKLTDNFQIIVYNNMIKFKSHRKNPSNPNNTVNIERKIKSFSENSRRNLSKHLCKIRFSSYKHRFFVTLTFHNKFPANQTTFKKILDNFNKRLMRFNHELSYIWKLEYQQRGTPHLHYLLLLKKRLSYGERTDFVRLIKTAWIECVGDDDELFKQMSVDIREVSNNGKTANYLLKYIGKINDEAINHTLGRIWAVSENLDENPLRVIKVDETFYENARTFFLKFIKEKYNLSEDKYERLCINDSFEIQLWHKDVLTCLELLSRKSKLSYIIYQLQNSPP
jgi:hypothetical protein